MAAWFETPENEQSFSGMVDQVVRETGRATKLNEISAYVNLTVRECQTSGLFAADLVEDTVTSTADPHIWTKPPYFRSLRAVLYTSVDIYPKLKLPGRSQQKYQEYFYSADDYFAFKGSVAGEVIALAMYKWAKPLNYYRLLGVASDDRFVGSYAIRPAYFDTLTETWMYLNDTDDGYTTDLGVGEDAEEETRRKNVGNWLVNDWYQMVLEGTKAKVFKNAGDPRAQLAYGNYMDLRKLLANTAGFEAEGFVNVGG